MRKPRIAMIAVLSAIAIVVLLLASAQPTAAGQRIGLSLPLSGPIEKLGRQFLAGAQMKFAEASPEDVTLLPVDDRCYGEVARLAAEELATAGVVMVTGILCNEVAHVLAEELKETQIPLLVAGARSPRLTIDRQRFGWHVFRLAPDDTEPAAIAAQVLGRLWAGKAYAIIEDGTVHGRNLADAFRALMEEGGQPPHFVDTFRPTQSTQAGLVRRLRRAGVTHAFAGTGAEDLAMIARNAAEIGIPLELAGGGDLTVLPFLPQDQRPPDGMLAVLATHEVASAVGEEIRERFDAAGVDPEPYALLGYRTMEVALSALRDSAGETAAALSQSRFETLFEPVAFDESGANTVPVHALYRWQDGKFTKVDP